MYFRGLCQQRLKEVLDYDPLTGIFTWKVSLGSKGKVGQVAGSTGDNNKGYIIIGIDGERYGAHQLAWFYIHGVVVMIDHKDGKPANNPIDNLQPSTYEQNNRKKYNHNPLGYKGVRFRYGKFHAHIRINGIITRIGSYDTAWEAGEAYATAANEIYGTFENREDQRRCVS